MKMKMEMKKFILAGALLAATTSSISVLAQPGQGDQDTSMSFFITSRGLGNWCQSGWSGGG